MKRILTYIAISAMALGFAGCEGFLVREPHLQQSNELTLSTYDGLNKAVAGAYTHIASTSWYGQSWVIGAEMRSGNGVKNQVRNSGRCTAAYDWNYTPESTSGIWSYCYVLTAAVNNIMDNLEGKADVEITEQDLNNLRAESLFLRAFAHFHCVLTYGQPYTHAPESLGVPVVLHTDPAGKPARETVAKVYEQVVADLLEAELIIDPEYVRQGGADVNAYVNVHVIRAFLSRVYLYMGEWQKSADYATKVIDSGKYTMWTAEQYPEVWGTELGTGEVIFEIYGKRTNSAYGKWEDMSYLTSPDGSGDPMVSKELLGMYAAGDVRLDTYITTDVNNAAGRYWTAKYPGKGDNAAPDCNNIIIMRLSEMYLTRAEALLNGAVIAGATPESDLNTIAANRGVANFLAVTAQDIKNERRKELAWEGHYIYDLARWGQSVNRDDAEDFTLISMNRNVEFPNYRWALPLPQSELNVNENLVQNEGYEQQ